MILPFLKTVYQISEEVITGMSEKEKKILDTFEKVLPDMTELERENSFLSGKELLSRQQSRKNGSRKQRRR